MVRRLAACAFVGGVALAGCSSGGMPPGDHFFRSVVAGAGADGAATANILILDPKLASKRNPGSPGSTPAGNQVTGSYYPSATGAAIPLDGTYDPGAGTFTASGGGWTFSGTYDANGTKGKVQSPSGSNGTFAGEDVRAGKVGTSCGTYSGGDSGTWNLVVSGGGGVAGAFSGGARGTISGTASGSSLSLSWSGTSFGAQASGTASGTVDASGTIAGSWAGSSGKNQYAGTWKSDGTCSGTDPTVFPDESGIPRQCPGCYPDGMCCQM